MKNSIFVLFPSAVVRSFRMKTVGVLGLFFLFSSPQVGTAQTNWLPVDAREYRLMERLDIRSGGATEFRFQTAKPFSGKALVEVLQQDSSLPKLTRSDEWNRKMALMLNSEWVEDAPDFFQAKRPLFKTFYKNPAHFLEVKEKDFFLVVDPVLQMKVMREQNSDEALFQNTRGITLRGMIAKKLSFSTYLTENQERGPSWFRDWVADRRAVPGVGFYKTFKNTGVDYFDARGSFTFAAAKYLQIQFGYDKQFIGDGYRSLFLSDFANNQLFLKVNTRIWKFNYQNLFMELTPQYTSNPNDNLLPKKYAAMHHLSLQATRWLQVGLFEGVIFGRKDRFDFTYLNPIIFLRSVEQQNGSADNGIAGLDFKAYVLKRFQVYGQLMLDEFKLSEIRAGNGWWANKWGIQLGGKYVDAFGVPNLDLQLEGNIVRPFSYTFRDSVASYNHYNQPLAHPLGANFRELVARANYQPIPRLQIDATVVFANMGLDTANQNFGNNIFDLYTTRAGNYGFRLGGPVRGKMLNAALHVGYEWKPGLFLEAGLHFRKIDQNSIQYRFTQQQAQTTVASLGLRLNMARRKYDY